MSGNKLMIKLVRLVSVIVLSISGLLSSLSVAETKDIKLVSFEAAPYIFPSGSTEPGLAVRYVAALMQRAGLSYNITLMPPKRAILFTMGTPGTCVFPVERSQEREVRFSWISPILISRHGLFERPLATTKSLRVLSDARGLRIGSYLGSSIGDYLISLGFDVDFAANDGSNIHKLMAKRIDFWAADTLTASYLAAQNNITLPPSRLVFFTTLRAMACHPSIPKTVIDDLNHLLQTMYQDGSFNKLQADFEANLLSMLD